MIPTPPFPRLLASSEALIPCIRKVHPSSTSTDVPFSQDSCRQTAKMLCSLIWHDSSQIL